VHNLLNVIISMVGIPVPRTIEEAYQLDREHGTNYWHQAIMKNNAIAFRFLEQGESVPAGSTWIPCHMIFNVTKVPTQLTYSSVVTRDSIRIAFLLHQHVKKYIQL
jgi:hypothetical protein